MSNLPKLQIIHLIFSKMGTTAATKSLIKHAGTSAKYLFHASNRFVVFNVFLKTILRN